MGVREETLKMLREGLSPKEVSRARGVNINTTLQYLDQLVGQGQLRRSDILFTVPKEIRQVVTEFSLYIKSKDPQAVARSIQLDGLNIKIEDVRTVLKYGDASHALGDMYEDVRAIETYLHAVIRQTLLDEYGIEERGWWRQGIPESVRKGCVIRQEEDSEPVSDPYCYTELLDLWQILDKQWNLLSKVLPEEITKTKQDLRRKMVRLNTIRRNVMHPVRGVIPSEEDFESIREFKKQLLIGLE